jgi:hypothetical protein
MSGKSLGAYVILLWNIRMVQINDMDCEVSSRRREYENTFVDETWQIELEGR